VWSIVFRMVIHDSSAVQPAPTLLTARLMNLRIEQIRYLTLISAMPCGFFGPVFGSHFGSNPPLARSGPIASHVCRVATLPVRIAILNHLACGGSYMNALQIMSTTRSIP
jgi:predicted permease